MECWGAHENQGSSIRKKNQELGGAEEKGKYWGIRLAKLYHYIVCMCRYVMTNPTIMYNLNAPIKIWKEITQALTFHVWYFFLLAADISLNYAYLISQIANGNQMCIHENSYT